MKLRGALAAAAMTGALVPVALFCAPAAFADGTPRAPGAVTTTPGATTTPADSGGPTAPADEESAPGPGDGAGTPPPTDGSSSAPDASSPAAGSPDAPSPSATSPTPSDSASPGDDWNPGECTDLTIDEKLAVGVDGLPGRIVAGSGWHAFTFTLKNNTDTDLKNVYVQTFTEYADGVNEQDSLQLDLARLQFRNPATGKWSDDFQDYYDDEAAGGDQVPYTGTFIGVLPTLGKGERVEMALRVRVDAKAKAGDSFALSSAVWAGEGTTCNTNGDTYDFTVLKAGSTPGDVDDAKPNGDKPGLPDGTKPQGGTDRLPVEGSLASTGTSSALPVIGLFSGVAVLAGAGVVYAVRRSTTGGAGRTKGRQTAA